MEGIILIDKDKGRTSFDVVRDLRRITGQRRIGHGGTLDPLATGLLVVAIGKATKKLNQFLGSDKEYLVRAHFGMVSDSYDADGKIVPYPGAQVCDEVRVREAIEQKFRGEIEQMPPKFSALKVGGKRAYDLARAGKEVKLEPRKVKIYSFELEKWAWPLVDFRVKVGSGTYVRSLVNDLGEMLKCGGYVEELRRTRVGDFDVKDAHKVSDLSSENIGDLMLA